MSNPNYSLDIISHHPQFSNKTLRKYHLEGIDTIGAYGDENFTIKFTNHTGQKIQVKLALDGTDIMSGEPATTDPSDKMWVVQPYGQLSLKAWPENMHGGAAFVFTSANNSVAVHTHGNLSSQGIIAAAVFVDGHKPEPITYNPVYIPIYPYYPAYPYPSYPTFPYWYLSNIPYIVPNITCAATDSFYGDICYNSSNTLEQNFYTSENSSVNLASVAGVGAGGYTEQNISYVAGLIKPIFTETVRVKYIWWDQLKEKLYQNNVPAPHASGFPGDKNTGINLGNTPRLGQSIPVSRIASAYSRI